MPLASSEESSAFFDKYPVGNLTPSLTREGFCARRYLIVLSDMHLNHFCQYHSSPFCLMINLMGVPWKPKTERS